MSTHHTKGTRTLASFVVAGLATIAAIATPALLSAQPPQQPPPQDDSRHMVNPFSDARHAPPPVRLREFRSIDGSGNNPDHPEWGQTFTPLARLTTVAYSDGTDTPSGADRPNARDVSNAVCAQSESITDPDHWSDFLWQWGQFVDHDISETTTEDPLEPFDISVPTGDPYLDPFGTGTESILLNRSGYDYVDGVRQQVNAITSFIDASNVYGCDETRVMALRTLDGTGHLKTSEGGLLPFNVDGLENTPTSADPSYFLAGDIRANETQGLLALHTLFVREHNYWADRIVAMAQQQDQPSTNTLSIASLGGRVMNQQQPPPPALTDEDIYQMARAIVAAEMQVITYHEFLPALLGPDALPPYRGYNPHVDPSLTNEFTAAAYRFGHSMISDTVRRIGPDLQTIPEGDMSITDTLFNPQAIEDTNIDPVLRGLALQVSQKMDPYMIDEERNILFGPPGSGGTDLAALDIQRGRDHGLPSYNQVRVDYGLDPVTDFTQISSDPEVQQRLASVYPNVDAIDPWIGMVCEDPVPRSVVGETLFTILTEQFAALRDGDRFWYRSYLPPQWVDVVEHQRLADIIRRNTHIGAELPENVFRVPPPPNGDPNATPPSGDNPPPPPPSDDPNAQPPSGDNPPPPPPNGDPNAQPPSGDNPPPPPPPGDNSNSQPPSGNNPPPPPPSGVLQFGLGSIANLIPH